jgi:hypothetical protein
MQNIEEKIANLRLAEAVQKDFFGQTGKIAIISKIFGSEIIQDNFDSKGINYLYEEIEENKINEFDMNHTSSVIGYHFDGLKMGMPLEIVLKENYNSIKVLWQGRVVYEEADGELLAFNPLNEWERNIDSLYKRAEEKVEKEKNKNKDLIELQMKKEEDKEIDRIRKKWGIL